MSDERLDDAPDRYSRIHPAAAELLGRRNPLMPSAELRAGGARDERHTAARRAQTRSTDQTAARAGVNESKGEHVQALAGEEVPFLIRVDIGEAVRMIVDRWHAAGSPTDPEVLRALAAAPDVTAGHGVTPEPPAGSEHYREGWRDGYTHRGIDTAPTADAAELEHQRRMHYGWKDEAKMLREQVVGLNAELGRLAAAPAPTGPEPEGMDLEAQAARVEPDYVEDGVQGWLVGVGLDVERDGTGTDTCIRIGGAEQPVQRVRALRDALSAALEAGTTEES